MIDTQRGNTEKVERLRELASSVRRRDLQVVHGANLGHVGGEMSAIDILVTLYFAVLRIDPLSPDDPERDRFILSKGHSAVALYTTLAHAGFFPLEELKTFAQPLSLLNGHPDRKKVPGVETNTGPLGHGLPVAVGAALLARRAVAARHRRVRERHVEVGVDTPAARSAVPRDRHAVQRGRRNGIETAAPTERGVSL